MMQAFSAKGLQVQARASFLAGLRSTRARHASCSPKNQAKIEEFEQLPRLLETAPTSAMAISVARKLRITPRC